jgi:uncharacterized protein YpmB
MKDRWTWISVGFLIIALISFLCSLYFSFCENKQKAIEESFEKGYIAACNDFYNGKIKYDVIENTDGTIEWRKIK